MAPDYVLVHTSVAKKFTRLLKKAIKEFYGHDPQQSQDYGRIINERQFDRLQTILDKERDTVTFGGRTDREDLYMEPTVLESITWIDLRWKMSCLDRFCRL